MRRPQPLETVRFPCFLPRVAHPSEPRTERPGPRAAALDADWHARGVTIRDPKTDLHDYLRQGRAALLFKLDGLSAYDVRRPLVPTGTNLLGLVKHVAGTEAGYLGETFGRPFPEPLPWMDDDAEPDADMWATPAESQAGIVDLYRRVAAHSDATIDALDLDATGAVPWWSPETNRVTLHQVLVHLIAETHRHAGHADIVRELIDGAVGRRAPGDDMAPGDEGRWPAHRDRLEEAARQAGA